LPAAKRPPCAGVFFVWVLAVVTGLDYFDTAIFSFFASHIAGGVNTPFSYLISRFLEGGLGYPVENTGRLVGVTSLISASALFVYLSHSKLLPRRSGASCRVSQSPRLPQHG
jgi:hypothetical protein